MLKTALVDILVPFLPTLWACLGIVITAAFAWVMTKLAAKFKIQISAETQGVIQTALGHGVAWAEQWASNKFKATGVKPTGNAKLDAALSLVQAELSAHNIPALATAELTKLIEAKLNVDANWFASIPAPAAAPATATATVNVVEATKA